MDIREVKESKSKFGGILETRFLILHSHANIAKLENTVANLLATMGPQIVTTKKTLFELEAEGVKVKMVLKQLQPSEVTNFMSFPDPIRLFCNEALILHNNQHQFQNLCPDEIQQILLEFQEVATDNELYVSQGKNMIHVKLDGNKLQFNHI